MDPNTLRQIIEDSLRDPWNFPWLVFLCLIVVSGFGSFFGSFLSKWGSNLADKQSIAELTKKVEQVRHEFETARLAQSFKQQLRMAALDKRIEAHQEAYALWRRLLEHRDNPPECSKLAEQCRQWYVNKSLYLEPQAREAFVGAYEAAFERVGLLNSRPNIPSPAGAELMEGLRVTGIQMVQAGKPIVEGVGLPSINTESRTLE